MNPKKQPTDGIATAAVWWPNRTMPMSTLEYDYGLCEQRSLGMAIMGYLGGYTSSSSRIELLGVILSLFSDQPLHLAVDNASVVRRASMYLDWLLHDPSGAMPGKPLGITKNGDLWQIVCGTLRARGPDTFRIKKTKGHALANTNYLKRFSALRDEAIGNNEAEKYAGRAKFCFYNANHFLLSEILSQKRAAVCDIDKAHS